MTERSQHQAVDDGVSEAIERLTMERDSARELLVIYAKRQATDDQLIKELEGKLRALDPVLADLGPPVHPYAAICFRHNGTEWKRTSTSYSEYDLEAAMDGGLARLEQGAER